MIPLFRDIPPELASIAVENEAVRYHQGSQYSIYTDQVSHCRCDIWISLHRQNEGSQMGHYWRCPFLMRVMAEH